MQCKDVRYLMNERPSREWDPGSKTAIERHAAACPDCARQLAVLRDMETVLADVPQVGAPVSLAANVAARTARLGTKRQTAGQEVPKEAPATARPGRLVWGAFAAGLVLASGAHLYLAATRDEGLSLTRFWLSDWRDVLTATPQAVMVAGVLAVGFLLYTGTLLKLFDRGE